MTDIDHVPAFDAPDVDGVICDLPQDVAAELECEWQAGLDTDDEADADFAIPELPPSPGIFETLAEGRREYGRMIAREILDGTFDGELSELLEALASRELTLSQRNAELSVSTGGA